MELDDLKGIWKQQKPDPHMEYSQSELLMLINNKVISLEKDIRWRDWMELIACAVVTTVFGFYFFATPSLWMQIGSVVIILSCILIGYRLIKAQPVKSDANFTFNHSIGEHLKKELQNVKTQRAFLHNVGWWYIGPICTGLILFAMGFALPLIYKLSYIGFIITMGIGIWYINQKVVAERFDLLITELYESLRFLEEDKK